ncbi:hypothetical protein HCA55_09320 [Listeria booriae]|uniref:DUF5050 domain-containing protein n=1 Tax=Listeria booriae TaxID=1552123 RepID=A0A842B3L6_9LIST|nr:hypothetical protein [Listeria booriae]MBC1796929.1 hypothetical protein [Listeria booriae]MBC2328111.1 hypothetical protein [Listeria booriae]
MNKRKKRIIMAVTSIVALSIVLATGYLYTINNVQDKKLEVSIDRSEEFVSYNMSKKGSLYSAVINKDNIYTLISTGEDSPSREVFEMNKKSGSITSIYTSMYRPEEGELISLAGNEDYLVWLDQNSTNYLSTLVVYDVKKKKIINKFRNSDEKYFDSFILREDTVYWVEDDTTKNQEEVGTGEDKDTMIMGNYTGTIKSYNLVSGKQRVIDTITTVNYPNNELGLSENKLWYIDNRKYEENALIKTYDINDKTIEQYDLGEPFLGHIKPTSDKQAVFFKYTIHAPPKGLYLFNTDSKKVDLINKDEGDTKAAYNLNGEIITNTASYKIDLNGDIYWNKSIQQELPDNFFVSSANPISSMTVITRKNDESLFNTMLIWNESAIKWTKLSH